MRKIPVTLVETFRTFADEEKITEGELLTHIRGEFHPTPAMEFGTAYHRFLERGSEENGALIHIAPLGSTPQRLPVASEVLEPAIRYRQAYPEIRMPGRKATLFDCPSGQVEVRGVPDGIIGNAIHEHKTVGPGSRIDYRSSYQWRLYCEIFSSRAVQYNLFHLQTEDAAALSAATSVREFADCVTLITLESFIVYSYQNLREDCCKMVARLDAYLSSYESIEQDNSLSENEQVLARIRRQL